MEEFDQFDINVAVKYLKEGYVIRTCPQSFQVLSYFGVKHNKIYYLNSNLVAPISYTDFINQFSDYLFCIIDEGDEVVDIKKDQEYYSWGKKM